MTEVRLKAIVDVSVACALAKQSGRSVSTSEMQKIAKRYSMSLSHFYRIVRWGLEGQSLDRLTGSGRKALVMSTWVQEWFRKKSEELGGIWTTRTMLYHMENELGGLGSLGSTISLCRILKFRKVKARILPTLNAAHMKKRLQFAQAFLERPDRGPDCVEADLDEKWFFAEKISRRYWLAEGQKPPIIHISSKCRGRGLT